jgi:CHAT domain-containing protein/tetratricopeptide (TPR) repeat protein
LCVTLSLAQERERVSPPDARVLLAAGLYEQAEVTARYHVDALRAAHGEDDLQVAGASDVLVCALVLNGRAASEQTLILARRTLRIKETRLGVEHADLVPSLLNLGDVLVAAFEFAPAIAVIERALASSTRLAGPDSVDVADALDHLGNAMANAGRYDEAEKSFERSLRLKEKALPETNVTIARTLEDLALVLQRKGDYDRADVPLRRAAAIQERANVHHPAYARTQDLIAQQLWFESRLVESEDASERAVEIAQRTLRPDHPTVALSLRHLAGTVGVLGDLSRSQALKEQALGIAQRNFGAGHPMTGVYLHSLGLAELDQGAYATARQHLQQALKAYEAGYGGQHEYIATALSVLAETDAKLGDYANARREQARAVEVHTRVGGPNHPFVATALTELASVYRQQGSPSEALPLLQRALAIREKNFGSNDREVARALGDMASTLMQMGRPAGAQEIASHALHIWAQLDVPDAPEYASALALYAEIQGERGDYSAAKIHYEKAMQIRARVFGTSHPAYAEAESGLALALANLRQASAALEVAADAEAIGRDHLRLMLRSLPERQALNYAAARPRGLNLILSLSSSMPEAIPVAVNGLIRSRALVLDEIAVRHSAGSTASERTDPQRIALKSVQQRLANLMTRGPGEISPAQYAMLVDDTRRESELAEQTLAEQSAQFRAERSRAQIGLQEVMAALPADSVLLSFARYDRTLFGGPARSVSNTIASYAAFVLRAGQPEIVVQLGSARAIDALIATWRADIAAEALGPPSNATDVSLRSSRKSGATLRRLVWDPLTAHLAGASRIFVVTDGSLNLVPFVALPVGQRSYVLDNRAIVHYLSAERDLVLPPPASNPGRGLLAIGSPSFDDASLFRGHSAKSLPAATRRNPAGALRDAGQACGDFQAARFPALIGTRQEVNELSGLWDTGAKPAAGFASTRVLVGRDASETTFKEEAPHYRVLHLATHGFFLGACHPSLGGTRSVGGLSKKGATSAAGRKAVENPLLLSGLALAGANRRALARADEDDGILTAEEVASLELYGVEWAVLSACDTGVGEVKAGEGVLGLRRAFQVAGARTVIMSLWPVEDQGARAWMRALYEGRLQKGLDTAEAVREASLSVLRQRRAKGLSTHPFYWAGFVAAGDWR